MNARGFHADARGPAPAQLAFGSDARGGLGGDDLHVGVRPAAGEIDHPAFRHVGHAAAIGREPAFRGLRNETGRGTEISGGAMLGRERHVGVPPNRFLFACQLYPSAKPNTAPLRSKFGVMSPVEAVCWLVPTATPTETPKKGPFQS